jgi:ADP-heptose:LPS heptosyltransferase
MFVLPLSSTQKILMIHAGGIGDLLLALPAMRIFRQAFPGFQLELMGKPARLSLVAYDLQATSVHSVDQAGMAYFYVEDGPLPEPLRTFFSGFGAALIFGKSNPGIFSRNLQRTGIRRVLALPSFPPEDRTIHVSDFLVQSLRTEGLGDQASFPPLRLTGEARSWAEKFWIENEWSWDQRVLAIHPGSGSPAKNWDPKNFARVVDWAVERAEVLFILGPAEEFRKEEIGRKMKEKGLAVAEDLSLIQVAALLQKSSAYLGNDSGITHLAASLGIPTIAVFSITNPQVWGPRGPRVKILKGKCSPDRRSEKTEQEAVAPSFEAIEVAQVIEALNSFLPSTGI